MAAMHGKTLKRRQRGAAGVVWPGAQGTLKLGLDCGGELAGDLKLV